MKKILSSWKYPLVLPHLLCFVLADSETKHLIRGDVEEMNRRLKKKGSLAYYLVNHKPYRNLFYFRIGKIKAELLKLFLRKYPLFRFSTTIQHIGKKAYVLNHPYCTTINARSIGDNFTICQLTTLGNKMHGRNDLIPTIGNNVFVKGSAFIGTHTVISDHCFIGAHSTIGGAVHIGEQSFVGMAAVVFDDVKVGKKCIVGASTALKRNLSDFSVYKSSINTYIEKNYKEDEIESKLMFNKNVR